MNVEAIESFVLLAENKNFTKTAETQYVVQSTISNRINELEKYVGTELFTRDNKNVALTKAGETFLPYAKRMLMLKKEGIIKARSTGFYEDRLSIGTVDAIYNGLLSPFIKEYFLKFPQIAVKLKINHCEEIIRLLTDEILDIGFIYSKPKLNKFQITPFLTDEIVLVTSNKNEVPINKEIHCKKLLELPLLYADLGEEFFTWLSEELGASPLLRLSVDKVSCVVDYVKDGYGYAFVPKSIVTKELMNKDLVEIKIKNAVPPSRQIYMVVNKNKVDSPAVKEWLNLCRKE